MENETIGKIQLNYDHYSGADLYCDGAVEDELLSIVQTYSEVEYPKVIEEKKSWPVLYHLSSQRENIVDWLPIDKSMKVLEIGSGCGAITGALARKAGTVDCVDLSRKRSLINAYRHEGYDNICINVGNFADIEPTLGKDYDYVLLIGVFEYGQSYIDSKTPFEDFLKIVCKHRAKNGRVVIAIENRYGLKYWAGCREDHLGTYFSSVECYKDGGGVRTFSEKGLTDICKRVGIDDYHFYYPYPDYKFMTSLFSKKRLPIKGELYNNIRNFDGDRLLLFDEKAAFDGIIAEEQFPFFSNSYLMIIGDEAPVTFARYSNDRAPEYQLCTEMEGDVVRKRAIYKNAGSIHIANMKKSYELLNGRYNGSKLKICPCEYDSEAVTVTFPFIKGRQLTEYFDELVRNGDEKGFSELFEEYIRRIDHGSDKPVADYDLVFSNILVDGDVMKDPWSVIDYEWTEYRQVATKDLAFRALYCYLLEDESRNKFNYELTFKLLSLTPEESEMLRDREAAFQKQVTGKLLSMGELRELIGGAVIGMDSISGVDASAGLKNSVQIYVDTGAGFNEEESYFTDESYDSRGDIDFNLTLDSNTVKLRIDPMMDYCMTEIHSLVLNGEPLKLTDNKRVYINGKKTGTDSGVLAIFYYDDPCIVIELKDKVRSTGNELHVSMTTTKLTESMTQLLKSEVSKRIRF
ncbi:MAG: class I SAM-dependent methyltransferase [Lachnospiraceae bacterium]|nr:class I SAM-dependent methyltransferase [Lachnospiraceae bacterium]